MASSIDSGRVLDRLERMMAMANRAAALFPVAAREYDPGDAALPPDSMLALERALYVAIQDMLDITAMLASPLDRAAARSYRETVEALVAHGVVAPGNADAYATMASFRNLLAHEYDGLDYGRLLAFSDRLGDFESFARDVVSFLDREGEL